MTRYFKYFLTAALTAFAPHALSILAGSITLTGSTDIVIPDAPLTPLTTPQPADPTGGDWDEALQDLMGPDAPA